MANLYDSPYDSPFPYLAPRACGYASLVFPGAKQPAHPPVDEYAVEPETREELIDGRVMEMAPAGPPHGDRHFKLDYVLGASLAPGYVGSTDLLTRTSASWNFAADASIRKEGIDPATGHRYLEELAFEIKHTQGLKDITDRARQLVSRGVRRVFMICVKTTGHGADEVVQAGPVMEWSASEDQWVELAADACIEDPCLQCPVPVRALLDATESSNAVARALLAQDHPVLRAQILRETIVELCDVLAIELTPARRVRIDALDAGALRALRDHIKIHRCWDQ